MSEPQAKIVAVLMRLSGFFLLLTGWMIVLTAAALLRAWPQAAFVLAGVGVQALGLTQVIRSHLVPHGDKQW